MHGAVGGGGGEEDPTSPSRGRGGLEERVT